MRYAKVKVVNTDRMRGSKSRDMSVLDFDGKMLVIQDAAEIELSEYAINSLKDAIHVDTFFVETGLKEQPLRKEFSEHPRISVTLLSDLYEKGKKEILVEAVARVEPISEEIPVETVTAEPGKVIFNPVGATA